MSWKVAPIGRGGDLLYSQAGTPSLDLRFAETKSLTDYVSAQNLITFSRGSSATYVDSDGLIKKAATNQARFDHDPTTGESLGLLVEESRTNLLLRSEEFNNTSAWTANNLTVYPNAATAPSGQTTASLLTETNASNAYFFISQSTSVTSGTTYTYSIRCKPNGRSRLYLAGSSAAWGSGLITFDLLNNVVSGSQGWAGTISSLANGWYSITATRSASATGGYILGWFLLNDSGDATYTGDGTSGIYIWGAQLEAGTFPTSYIPTPATFTSRSTTATYYDANGTIQTAGINVARDDAYFPDENGVFKPAGLLLEAAGTNLVTYSEQFDNAAWGKLGNSITANSIAAPDSTTSADLLTVTSTAVTARIERTITLPAAGTYSYSVYLKKGNFNWITLRLTNFDTNPIGYFDISTGQVGSVSGGASGVIQNVGNGWYRCTVVFSTVTDLTGNLFIIPATGDGSLGSEIGDTLYLWGAQLEASPYPTSYIPTTTATVTRAADVSSSSTVTRSADVAQITGSNFSSWYNQSEGTVYCNFLAPTRGTGTSSYQVVSINDGNANEHIGLSRSFDPVEINANVVTGYITQASFKIYPIPVGNQKIALTYKSNYSNLAASGILSSADTNLIVPNPTQLNIGQDSAYTAYGLNSTISRLTYYPVRLPDATLQTITS